MFDSVPLLFEKRKACSSSLSRLIKFYLYSVFKGILIKSFVMVSRFVMKNLKMVVKLIPEIIEYEQ